MGLLAKIRQIFRSNPTYDKRSDKKLMKNAPWGAFYDRTNIPKDLHGSIDDRRKKNK